MDTVGLLIILFATALIASVLAGTIVYLWASSQSKSALLRQVREQAEEATRNAQTQLQSWKDRELGSIRQQIFDAAKGQAIQEMQQEVQRWREHELGQIKAQMLTGLRGEAIKEAQEQLVKWRNVELENAKLQIREVLAKESAVNFEKWRAAAEVQIRQDAIQKSHSVTTGKMTEHLVPYLPGFGFNPSDARFIGSPIDLVVFDGLGSGDVQRIVFIEIKTGASTLSTRERMVRDAVIARKIEWQEIRANFHESETLEQERVLEVVTPLSPEDKARRARARLYQKYALRLK